MHEVHTILFFSEDASARFVCLFYLGLFFFFLLS